MINKNSKRSKESKASIKIGEVKNKKIIKEIKKRSSKIK
jgi:hypothetical protein